MSPDVSGQAAAVPVQFQCGAGRVTQPVVFVSWRDAVRTAGPARMYSPVLALHTRSLPCPQCFLSLSKSSPAPKAKRAARRLHAKPRAAERARNPAVASLERRENTEVTGKVALAGFTQGIARSNSRGRGRRDTMQHEQGLIVSLGRRLFSPVFIAFLSFK